MRLASTNIQKAPGSTEWEAVMVGHNIEEQKDFLKSLPIGEQVAYILSTSGTLKRRKVLYQAKPAPKKRGRPPKSA